MTTPKPKIHPAPDYWESFPDHERVHKDMLQSPTINDLRERLHMILAPGAHFPWHPANLVSDEVPVYYANTDPATGRTPYVVPDTLVVLGIDTQAVWDRNGYDLRQVGKPPDFVMEVASHTTYLRDTVEKREIYREMGVPEYWRFDPSGGTHFGQPIIGEGLVNGIYEQFPVMGYADGAIGSTSALLNLDFRWGSGRFRIHNPATGAEYENPREANDNLQAEIARLQAENRRLRGDIP